MSTDDDAFAELVRRHQVSVYRYVRRRVPCADADDVVADVFAAAWRHRDRLPDRLGPWLYRTAWNALLHQFRGTRRREALAARMPRGRRPADGHGDPLVEQVRTVLPRLRPSDQELLRLHYWEGLAAADIAYVVGGTAATVRTRLARARRRLADLLPAPAHSAVRTRGIPVMTLDQFDLAVFAADPTGADDSVPSVAHTLRAARHRAEARPIRRRRRPRLLIPAAVVATVAAALVVVIPVVASRTAPTASAAIRLVPFAGLLTPYAVDAVPEGLGPATLSGQQGSTTAAYVPSTSSTDGVYVTHAAVPPEGGASEEPGAMATRQEADGSWVQVSGHGRFADGAVVAALLATAHPGPEVSPVHVGLAPSGWQVMAFKDLEPGDGVLTLAPTGNPTADTIDVIRYRSTAADFPAGYEGQGPTSALSSGGRAGTLMQGSVFWALQLRLADGGSLVLLLPTGMTRDQVQRFADAVTTSGP